MRVVGDGPGFASVRALRVTTARDALWHRCVVSPPGLACCLGLPLPRERGQREHMTMKAWVYDRYGSPDVLRFEEVETPTLGPRTWRSACTPRAERGGLARDAGRPVPRPAPVRAAAAAPPDDRRLRRRGRRRGGRRARHPLLPGDRSSGRSGSPEASRSRHRPRGAGRADAGQLHVRAGGRGPRLSGVTALRAIRDAGRVGPGTTVLLIGASGGVGTFALQIARALGGVVTAVCSPGATELVRSLGAGEVIDYTTEKSVNAGRTYDVIVNNGGTHSLRSLRRTLTREAPSPPSEAPSTAASSAPARWRCRQARRAVRVAAARGRRRRGNRPTSRPWRR